MSGSDARHGDLPADAGTSSLEAALAVVDEAMADGLASGGTTRRHQVVRLHALRAAVRAYPAEASRPPRRYTGMTREQAEAVLAAASFSQAGELPDAAVRADGWWVVTAAGDGPLSATCSGGEHYGLQVPARTGESRDA